MRLALFFRVQFIINNTPKHTRAPVHSYTTTKILLYSFSAEKTQKYYTLSDDKTLTSVTLIWPWILPVTEGLHLFFWWTNFKTPLQKWSLPWVTTVSLNFSHLVLAGSHKGSHRDTHPTLTYRYGCGELTPLLRFTVSFFTFCFREINCKIEGQGGRQKSQSKSNFNQFL